MPPKPYDRVASRLEAVTGYRPPNGSGDWRCPAHEDRNASLSVTDADESVVLHCHAGCQTEAVLERLGLSYSDLFERQREPQSRKLVASYPYVDEDGKLLFEVVRFEPKGFRQRRADGNGGWVWKLDGTRRVPYRLPEVIAAVGAGRTIYVVEGEKDVHAVEAAGEVATCNPGGASKWRPEYAGFLTGAAEVVVIADADEPGRAHARAVLASLKGKVVLAEPKVGKDAAEHLGAGLGLDDLEVVAADGPPARQHDDPGRWFDPVEGLLVADLGEDIRNTLTIRLGHDDRLYRYDGGVYRPDGDRAVKVTAKNLLGRKFKRRHLDELIAYLKADYSFIPEHPPREILNVANGLLDWRTGELSAHSSDVPSAVQVPIAWAPGATCPRIDRFLAEVLPDDAVEHGLEILGYGLYAGNPLQKAIMLLGPGGNGKSKLLALARALCGEANVSAVSLQSFGENRFHPAEVFGKLANICGDLDARAIKRTDLFKQMTGDDPITAERKFGHPFTFTCFALPVFAANESPKSADQTDAWFDRWLIVPFEVRFRDTPREDPHLAEKITAKAELEGLLVKAVDALRRLMDRGRFDPPESVRRAGDFYRDQLDTVRGFIGECCVFDREAWVARPALYQSYRNWAQSSGRFPVSADRFNAHLRANYPERITERIHTGTRGWAGIRVDRP